MAPSSRALGPGDRLGPYRIVRTLGVGGMGSVHEAVEEPLGRSVAVKVIAAEWAQDPSFRLQLTEEARAQALLDSPHVVQVLAHGELDGRLYIATQLVPDGDLRDLLRRHGALPRVLAVDLVAQVAAGLAEAHRIGLVHRDVKPGNVLLRDRGDQVSAYLADFGIARRLDGRASTRDGAGTPAYMAPELHLGRAAGIHTDVYAAGCLLWTLLTGAPPWTGTEAAIVEGHLHGRVPQLPRRDRLARGINRVLRGALAKDPSRRYAAAELLRDDLRALLRPTARRWHRVGTAAAALALAGVAAFALRPAPHDPRAPDVDRLASLLRTESHLDPAAARCAAQRLAAMGSTAPTGIDVQDTFAAGFDCLWPRQGSYLPVGSSR